MVVGIVGVGYKENCRVTFKGKRIGICLLYTSDAADDLLCVDLGGRRIIKKKTNKKKWQVGHRLSINSSDQTDS